MSSRSVRWPRLGELLRQLEKAKGTQGQLRSAGPGRGRKGKTGDTALVSPVLSTPTLAEVLNMTEAIASISLRGCSLEEAVARTSDLIRCAQAAEHREYRRTLMKLLAEDGTTAALAEVLSGLDRWHSERRDAALAEVRRLLLTESATENRGSLQTESATENVVLQTESATENRSVENQS
jgi:hypothetical protein